MKKAFMKNSVSRIDKEIAKKRESRKEAREDIVERRDT